MYFFKIWISLFPIYNCLGSHWFSFEVEFLTLFSHLVFEICIWPYMPLPFNEATYALYWCTWLIWSHHCTSVPITTYIVNITNKMWCDAGSKWTKVYSSFEKIQFPNCTILDLRFWLIWFFENSHCTNHMYTFCIC